MSTVIMAGELRGFDVPSVLQALSLSRQHTVLTLWDRNKRETGEFRLKAGQLLDAVHGDARGRTALHAILQSQEHHTFRVERLADSFDLAEPLGALASLLLDLASEPREPIPVSPPPARRPMRPVTAPPPPPAPRRSAASGTRPRPRVVQDGIANVGPQVAEVAEQAKPLEGLLLAKLPECLLCKSWSRSEPLVPPEVLATYVAQVVQSQRTCFADYPDAGQPRLTLELSTAVAMIEPVTAELVAVYVFDPGTPLGLIRLTVSHFHQILEQRARAELLPQLRSH